MNTVSIFEDVMLNPFGLGDVTSYISESHFDVDEYLREASKGTNKKNIFQKLWAMIKKIFRVIAVKVSEVFSAVTSIFRTKKANDKTLDQIAAFVLGDTTDAPGSKHLQFRYEDDKRITINYVADTVKGMVKEPAVPGHDPGDRPYQKAISLIFCIIKKPYLLDPILEMINSIQQNGGKITFPLERMQKAIDSLWAGTVFGFTCSASLEEWTAVNQKIIDLNKAMQAVDDDTFGTLTIDANGNGTREDWAKPLNELTTITAFLQKGINGIGDGMRQIYELDAKYHNRINSSNYRTMLPKFVKNCVETNIPSKYIHYAVRQISDVSINSKVNDPNTKPPDGGYMKGNGRFVIFPGDPALKDRVIKVGYNGLGVRGNRNEFVVWNKVKNIPEIAQELYQIYDIGDPDNYVIETDRATPIDHYAQCDEWNKRMRELCLNNNVGFIIRCNDGGFGEFNGKTICIDYGNVFRVDR